MVLKDRTSWLKTKPFTAKKAIYSMINFTSTLPRTHTSWPDRTKCMTTRQRREIEKWCLKSSLKDNNKEWCNSKTLIWWTILLLNKKWETNLVQWEVISICKWIWWMNMVKRWIHLWIKCITNFTNQKMQWNNLKSLKIRKNQRRTRKKERKTKRKSTKTIQTTKTANTQTMVNEKCKTLSTKEPTTP